MAVNLNQRIGHGYDIHRLKDGGELVLGGIVVASDISPIAHSDGDVVIHAIIDALLGAMGGGDIGEHFPNTDAQWKGAAGSMLLEKIMDVVRAAGWNVVNVDVTVLAERPKLNQFKAKIAAQLRALIGAPVNIKAGTNEGCDSIGRGEAIAAHAVVLLTDNK